MESESEIIMDAFSSRDIFPPREFDFIPVGKYFWRTDNRMKCCSFDLVSNMMKSLSDLIFFYFELVFVLDREPFAASIHLDRWIEIFFEWRFFDDIHYLSFDEA